MREGYRSVEHVKRYTTLGMGTDQGKTEQHAWASSRLRGRSAHDVAAGGTTTFRPPYVPVTLGALAGHAWRTPFPAERGARRCTTGTSGLAP